MLLRATVFKDVNGFNESNLAVAFNDVDLCLRVGRLGLLCVFTPYAQLYHYESLTRGGDMNPSEIIYMYETWGMILENDPFYNPNLTRVREDFTFGLDADGPKLTYPFGGTREQLLIRLSLAGLQLPESEEALNRLWTVYCSRPDLKSIFWPRGTDNLLMNLLEWELSSEQTADSSRVALEPFYNQYRRIYSDLQRYGVSGVF